MKLPLNSKVKVINNYSGGYFMIGDIVEIKQIGCEDDPNCYGAISPHDNCMWYLDEDEVQPLTNADWIRSLSNAELANLLDDFSSCSHCRRNGNNCFPLHNIEEWLEKEHIYEES